MQRLGEALGRVVTAVGRPGVGQNAKGSHAHAIYDACGANRCLLDGTTDLIIDNAGMVEVDQTVGGVREEGMPLW